MGNDIRFIAFRNEPNESMLQSLAWIEAFRLFRRGDKNEWQLEGPSTETQAPTFFEPMQIAADFKDNDTEWVMRDLRAAIKALGCDSDQIDSANPSLAVTLSRKHKGPVLVVFGDDEESDGGLIFENGALTGGMFRAGREVLTVRQDGACAPTADFPDDGVLYEIASRVASDYFGTEDPRRIDPFDFDPAEYTLIQKKGEARRVFHPGEEAKERLWEIARSARSGDEKLRASISTIDTYVSAALNADMGHGGRMQRDMIECEVSSCFLAMHQGSVAAPMLADYLSDLLHYLRLLRPKPEFRHDRNFVEDNQRLRERWQALRRSVEGQEDS